MLAGAVLQITLLDSGFNQKLGIKFPERKTFFGKKIKQLRLLHQFPPISEQGRDSDRGTGGGAGQSHRDAELA